MASCSQLFHVGTKNVIGRKIFLRCRIPRSIPVCPPPPPPDKMDELIEQMKLMNERMGKMETRMESLEQLIQIHDDWLMLPELDGHGYDKAHSNFECNNELKLNMIDPLSFKYKPGKPELSHNENGYAYPLGIRGREGRGYTKEIQSLYENFRRYKEKVILDERLERERKEKLRERTERGEKIEFSFTPEEWEEVKNRTPEGEKLLKERTEKRIKETKEDSGVSSLADKVDGLAVNE